ncbi:glutamate receptor ionotropic, kainate 3-like [Panulirus ornatus]|uniref:glutamate receptor ionotropic, kainate 3-like n=1 Tax=Panulirus ornatus TaxID=150431 RepID=UPI003A8B1523
MRNYPSRSDMGVPVGVLRALWFGSPRSVAVQKVEGGREVARALDGGHSQTLNVAFLRTPEEVSLFVEISRESLVRRYLWLVLGDIQQVTAGDPKPRLQIDNLVTFASLITAVTNSTNRTRVDFFEIYSVTDDLPYITRKLGSWKGRGVVKLPKDDWSDRRTNLTGLHLRCVTMAQAPFTYLSEPDSQMNVEITGGYAKDVWDSLKEIHGFTYSCRMPEDLNWGSLTDGKWNGMVRELVDQKADVVVTALDHNTARAKAIDFVTGLKEVGYQMVARRPGLMEETWTSFTSELLPDAWLGTLAFVVLAPPCLTICAYFSPLETQKVTLKDAYILAIGAFAIQGSWLDVRSVSSRIVFLTIFLATLVVYAHYTSALVSLLTVTSTNTGFNSLQDLLLDESFKFGFKAGTFLEVEFKNAEHSIFKEVWEKLVAPDPSSVVANSQDGINKVVNERYIYMMEGNEFRVLFGRQCRVILVKTMYFSTQTGFALAPDSPYRKVFDTQLMRMRDGGVLSRSWHRWQPPPTLCTAPRVVALDIHHLFTAFLLLVLGLILSIVLLPCERLHWNAVGKRKLHREKLLLPLPESLRAATDPFRPQPLVRLGPGPIFVQPQRPQDFNSLRGLHDFVFNSRT